MILLDTDHTTLVNVCLQLGVEPMRYTNAVRAAALPGNQRRQRRAVASTSELDRPTSMARGQR
jgi:hypothetical protein